MIPGNISKKRKTVIVVHGYSHHFWGSEKVALEVGDSYQSQGYDVVFFLPDEGYFTDVVRKNGFRVEIQNTIIPSLRRPGRKVKLLFEVIKKMVLLQPEFVHSTSLKPVPALVPAVKVLGIKLFAQLQTIYDEKEMRRRCLPLVDVALPVSGAAEKAGLDYLQEQNFLGRSVFRRLPPAIDAKTPDTKIRVSELQKQWNLNSEDIVVGMVGQVIPRKGTDVFLKAIAVLLNKGIKVKTVIVGDSPLGFEKYNNEIKKMILDLGLSDSVVLTGFVRDVPAHLMAMDIVAMPSREEGFGLVAGESMRVGKPVVASRVGGLKELVTDRKTGLLVESEDVQALAESLELLIRDKVLRRTLGDAGKREMVKNYSRSRFHERLQEIVSEFFGNNFGEMVPAIESLVVP